MTASRPELPSASWMSARIRPGRLLAGELHRLGAGAGDAGHVVAEPFDERLEIHRDQRLVLDDEDVGRHVGGELAARPRRRARAPSAMSTDEDRGRPPPRRTPSRQESRKAWRGSGVIWPMRTSAGRSRWICSLLPLTDSEFQIRVKTSEQLDLDVAGLPDRLRLADERLEGRGHIGVASHLAARQGAGVAAKIRQVLDDQLRCRHSHSPYDVL